VDGLFRFLASPAPLDFPGEGGRRPCYVKPLTLRVLGMAEAWLFLRERNQLDTALDLAERPYMTKPAREKVVAMACEDMRRYKELRLVPLDRMQHWLGTVEGAGFTLHHSLGYCCPEVGDVGRAVEFVRHAPDEFTRAFLRVRDAISGFDLLSSFDWPTTRVVERPTDKTKYFPWKRIFRFFAEEYGWLPDQVGTLTLYLVKEYTCAEKELGGVARGVTKDQLDALTGGRHRRTPRPTG
jgi:hypothetical protein